MARFFFHFIEGVDRCEDELGLEFPSVEAAYLEAVAGAQAMWAEILARRSNPNRCAFEVANDKGDILFRLDFAELLASFPAGGSKTESHTMGLIRSLQETHARATSARSGVVATLASVRNGLREARELLVRLNGFGPRRPPHDPDGADTP